MFTITLYFRKGEKVLLNSSAGYLVRSKPVGQNEGSVFIGRTALDSVALTSP